MRSDSSPWVFGFSLDCRGEDSTSERRCFDPKVPFPRDVATYGFYFNFNGKTFDEFFCVVNGEVVKWIDEENRDIDDRDNECSVKFFSAQLEDHRSELWTKEFFTGFSTTHKFTTPLQWPQALLQKLHER